jgi:hypothetical protein
MNRVEVRYSSAYFKNELNVVRNVASLLSVYGVGPCGVKYNCKVQPRFFLQHYCNPLARLLCII